MDSDKDIMDKFYNSWLEVMCTEERERIREVLQGLLSDFKEYIENNIRTEEEEEVEPWREGRELIEVESITHTYAERFLDDLTDLYVEEMYE